MEAFAMENVSSGAAPRTPHRLALAAEWKGKKRKKLKRKQFPDTTKAHVVVPNLCIVPVADRDAQPPRIVGPGAPANHSPQSLLRTFRISGISLGVIAPPIRCPLPDVSGKVVNTLRRGALRVHSNGRWLPWPSLAVIRPELVRLFVAPWIAHACPASARGALPLGFGGQTPSHPRAIGGSLIPAHLNYRPVRIAELPLPMSGRSELPVSTGLPELLFRVAISGDEALVLEHRYGIAPNEERRDFHLVDRRLVLIRFGVIRPLRAHPELPALHADPVFLQ